MHISVLAIVVLGVAVTLCSTVPAYGRTLELDAFGVAPARENLEPTQPRDNTTGRLRWGAGLRAQAFYESEAWTELGADAVVYPWRHLGLGVTVLQGAGPNAADCESVAGRRCGPYWRAIAPFAEGRLFPEFWVSPYARSSVGVAWGDLSRHPAQPRTTAFAVRSELGIDLHHRVSLRLYLAHEHLGSSSTNINGFGGGLQVGLTL